MQVIMQHAELLTPVEMREFLSFGSTLSFTAAGRKQIYGRVERTLRTQQYLSFVENGSSGTSNTKGRFWRV